MTSVPGKRMQAQKTLLFLVPLCFASFISKTPGCKKFVMNRIIFNKMTSELLKS